MMAQDTAMKTILAAALTAWLSCLSGCSWDTVSGSDSDTDRPERVEATLHDSTAAAGLAYLSVETENGGIEVTAADGDWVQVRVHTEVRAASLARAEDFATQVEVRVERDGDGLRLYHQSPRPPADIEVIVNYAVECPPQVIASLAGVNGDIAVTGLTAATAVAVVNGRIDYQGSRGPLSAISVNGDISATIRDLAAAASLLTANGTVDVTVPSGVGSLAVQSTNGTVAVHLHRGFGGRLDAQVTQGQIHSGIDLTATQVSDTRLRGTLGAGGDAEVELRVTNGTIRIDTL